MKDDFYNSEAWFAVRYKRMRMDRGLCQLCGRGRKHGVVIQVDHIKPRSKYPKLELDINNLQTCCRACNLGKSNLFEDDWRGSIKPTINKSKLMSFIQGVSKKSELLPEEPFHVADPFPHKQDQ